METDTKNNKSQEKTTSQKDPTKEDSKKEKLTRKQIQDELKKLAGRDTLTQEERIKKISENSDFNQSTLKEQLGEIQREKRSTNNVIFGIAIFLMRYVPLFDRGKNLSEASNLCGTFAGNFAEKCSWIEPLNIIMIAASIGFVIYGIVEKTKK